MSLLGSRSQQVFAVGVSHHTVPVELLERLAFSGGAGARVMGEVASHDAIDEVVLLSTCNRTELYLVVTDCLEAERVALATLCLEAGVAPTELRLQPLWGADGVRHLFRVAAGLESMVVGETEIQGQVRRAYKLALLEGVSGPITGRLFRGALEAGKRVRRATGSVPSPPSVASIAVEFGARSLGGLVGRRALIIGTGENAELTGRSLSARGARVTLVANRRRGHAEMLARSLGGRAVGFDELRPQLARADLAFGCTASPRQVLAADDLARVMEQRRGRPLLLIDTAVPRDIDPAARDLAQISLYDIDDLKRAVDESAPLHPAGLERADRILEHEVARLMAWLAGLEATPAISALREHADRAVQVILREHEPFWESPSAHDRERLRLVAHAVVNRLLHEPTMRLKHASGNGSSRADVQALMELFGVAAPGRVQRPRQQIGRPLEAPGASVPPAAVSDDL